MSPSWLKRSWLPQTCPLAPCFSCFSGSPSSLALSLSLSLSFSLHLRSFFFLAAIWEILSSDKCWFVSISFLWFFVRNFPLSFFRCSLSLGLSTRLKLWPLFGVRAAISTGSHCGIVSDSRLSSQSESAYSSILIVFDGVFFFGRFVFGPIIVASLVLASNYIIFTAFCFFGNVGEFEVTMACPLSKNPLFNFTVGLTLFWT